MPTASAIHSAQMSAMAKNSANVCFQILRTGACDPQQTAAPSSPPAALQQEPPIGSKMPKGTFGYFRIEDRMPGSSHRPHFQCCQIANMGFGLMEKQVVSKKRVADHGEVYTGKREVNAMLDLVKQETERIDSRFLEPACGKGNFLTEILERKLSVVELRYGNNQLDYERYAVLAASSVYGIDILEDNIVECRKRLFDIFDLAYTRLFKGAAKDECRKAIQFILGLNIVWGDALTLQTVGNKPQPIVFSEWSAVNGSMLKRRDFTFHGLLAHADHSALPLFSDLGEDVFLPSPVKDYPLTHYLSVADAKQQ